MLLYKIFYLIGQNIRILSMYPLEHLKTLTHYQLQDDMSDVTKQKIMSTARYSLSIDPDQTLNYAVSRCALAIYAEQRVADHMQGHVMNNDINFDIPLTYAYDVLSSPLYYGARIEVKTHQSGSRWINVNIEKENTANCLNLYHFLEYEIADYITIFNCNSQKYNNVFVGNRCDLKKIIRKSNYSGWYLHL